MWSLHSLIMRMIIKVSYLKLPIIVAHVLKMNSSVAFVWTVKTTRQAMYCRLCNIEACTCNHCCSGKGIIITYSESVFVALGIQRVHHIINWGLSDYTIFFPSLSHKRHNFRKKKLLKIKCVLISPTSWRNVFKCAWMWKETIFSTDYEQVLFCIVPDMCISYKFSSHYLNNIIFYRH
jgi:hypothetical protein